MAWLNRTGWRTLATQYSASSTGAAVASTTVERNGMAGILGVRSASAARNSGRIGSINAVCEATSMLTRRANRFCAIHRGDHRIDRRRAAPAITVCRGEA